MIFNAKSEPGVSPVIGTILLVAIAVILVAIILVVVMGFSGDTNEKKVGLNAQAESGANATLLLYGGASLDELVKLEMIDQDSPNGSYVKFWDINDNGSAFVGLPYLAEGVAQPEKDMDVYDTRINVRGTFSDGTEVILLIQPMTFYDVAGPGVSSEVRAPTVLRVSSGKASLRFQVDYPDPSITDVKLWYQPANGGTAVSVPATLTSSNNSSNVYTVQLTGLNQSMEYIAWGGISFTNKATGLEGDSTPFTVAATVMKPPYAMSIKGKGIKAEVAFNVDHPDSYANVVLWYQPANGGTAVSVPATVRSSFNNVYTYVASMTDLTQDTKYLFWAGISFTNSDIVLEGASSSFTTPATEVRAPTITVSSGGKATVQFLVNLPDSCTTNPVVWYQPADGGAVVSVPARISSSTNTVSDRYAADLTGLTPGVEYIVWGGISFTNSDLVLEGDSTPFTAN